ncbi:hypothetical protein L6452_11881 [Arctium lappa]|uniref:Uncharacterized protein n=1 Tax=Arctium lappa TaxID=4217 RepID=A0ACB9DQ12_ARCLA|nr:hypothetical protein L6452_11881 [Arctium lappa]
MEEYKDDPDETLSLSDLQMEEDTTVSSEEVNQAFYQDFFGFSNEESGINTSNKKSPTKIVSSNPPVVVSDVDKVSKRAVNPMFRSSSGSFRYMRLKIASTTGTWRSKSVSVMEKSKMVSKSKSKWEVLLPGLGSGKFPKKMDMSDIKSRQLRRQISTTDRISTVSSVDQYVRSWKKGWWRLVDVLGCGGGYVRDTKEMKDQMQKSMCESKKTMEVKIHGDMGGTEEQHSKGNQGSSPRKSKWRPVFMFGYGTAKFPTKMELNDIKSRQLRRQQTTTTVCDGGAGEDESYGRRSGDKRWWRLIDVFGCGGGYDDGDTAVKDLRATFRTLERFE